MSCEQPIQLGVFTVGEIPAPLRYTFTDYDGAAINLTAFTARFIWTPEGGTPTDSPAAVVDGPNGVVEYVWSGTEFATPGRHAAQFWVGNGTNRWASTKIKWTVQTGTGQAPAI